MQLEENNTEELPENRAKILSKGEKGKDRGPDQKVQYLKNSRSKKRKQRKRRGGNQRINSKFFLRTRTASRLKGSPKAEHNVWKYVLKCITVKFKDPGDTVTKSFERGEKTGFIQRTKNQNSFTFPLGGRDRRQRSGAFKILKNSISNLKIATWQTWGIN